MEWTQLFSKDGLEQPKTPCTFSSQKKLVSKKLWCFRQQLLNPAIHDKVLQSTRLSCSDPKIQNSISHCSVDLKVTTFCTPRSKDSSLWLEWFDTELYNSEISRSINFKFSGLMCVGIRTLLCIFFAKKRARERLSGYVCTLVKIY